jgi:hypothetical protein
MLELLRLIAGTCRLYAAEQTIYSLILLAAGLVLACLLALGLIFWARAFNRTYRFSGSQISLIILTCSLWAAAVPLWFAMNFAGKFGDGEVRILLRSLSEDPVAMSEIRQLTHNALSVGRPASPDDQPDMSTPGRWSFTMAPDEESVLSLANAYTGALLAAVNQRNELLSRFIAWGSAPGFLAADIRLGASQKPSHPYDLDPGSDALAGILTTELPSRTQAAAFMLRLLAITILIGLVSITLAWLGFAAYRDIHVHWPGEI